VINDEAKELLTKIGKETSLRYAIHMITVASLVCIKRKGSEVETADIQKVYSLFCDVKRSTEFLQAYQSSFVFNEVPEEEEGKEDSEMKEK